MDDEIWHEQQEKRAKAECLGSPIVQNGKLIDAVTHVFVNDPTRGYGIFIENMLSEAEKIE